MKNDVGSYMTRKIGTGRIDAYARLCLHDEVVQGIGVVPDAGCYKKRKIGTCKIDGVVRVRAFVPARRGRAGQRGRA